MIKKVRPVLALIIFVSVIIVYYYPQKIDITVSGIMYQLGEVNKQFEEPVTITINGTMRNIVPGEKFFNGHVEIEGQDELPIPRERIALELTLFKLSKSNKYHADGGKGLGGVYIDKDFSEITFTLLTAERVSFDEIVNQWDPTNGLMIAAPAENREDALAISNALMHEYLKGRTLK